MSDIARPFNFKHPKREALADMLSIEWDLERCANSLKLLLGPPEFAMESSTLAHALYTQALVSYVRCFSSGRRRALKKSVFSDRPELSELHDRLKTIRDRHLSHPVDKLELCGVYVAATSENSSALGIGVEHWFFFSSGPKELKQFIRLVRFVRKNVKEEIQSIGDEIARDIMGSKYTWRRANNAFYKALHKMPIS
jgi:hypothetical protein